MNELREAAERAARARHGVAGASAEDRTDALHRIAVAIRSHTTTILGANALDMERGRARGLTHAFLDRLELTPARVESMARAVEDIAAQEDLVGLVTHRTTRPNGLEVQRIRTPLGVIAVIYEARPNVTSDAAALAIRSGNAILLKGGSDASESNRAIGEVIADALEASALPADAVQVLITRDRSEIAEFLTYADVIDLVIPRGGEGLIRFVTEHSRIPVVQHFKGVCHVYIDAEVDPQMARSVAVNAKVSRPAACNSAETILVHEAHVDSLLPQLVSDLLERGVVVHGCERTIGALGELDGVHPATEADWAAEYLAMDVAIRVVGSVADAVEHVRRWGSDHTEAILSTSTESQEFFVSNVPSSCVMVNASTRFADGGELGLGAEIGISTTRVHAYGPMGAEGLTTTRFVVRGTGQMR